MHFFIFCALFYKKQGVAFIKFAINPTPFHTLLCHFILLIQKTYTFESVALFRSFLFVPELLIPYIRGYGLVLP